MKVTADTEIYVLCPGHMRTGGPEALHQFCGKLRGLGYNAMMVYIGIYHDAPVVEEYEKYNTVSTKVVKDYPDNIVVVPEACTECLSKFSKMQKVIWWLSVDNYYHSIYRTVDYFRLVEPDTSVIHLIYSEYARVHLQQFDIPEYKTFNVSANVRPPFEGAMKRRNRVLYNPKKGADFTQKIIDYCKDVKFMPISDFTAEQVNQLLSASKVYIDFGTHPGRERLPREAASNGCCVITGMRGSAKYYRDIPIEPQYKFADEDINIPLIADKIRECLTDYDTHIKNFEYYREVCRNAEKQFEQEIKAWITAEPT